MTTCALGGEDRLVVVREIDDDRAIRGRPVGRARGWAPDRRRAQTGIGDRNRRLWRNARVVLGVVNRCPIVRVSRAVHQSRVVRVAGGSRFGHAGRGAWIRIRGGKTRGVTTLAESPLAFACLNPVRVLDELTPVAVEYGDIDCGVGRNMRPDRAVGFDQTVTDDLLHLKLRLAKRIAVHAGGCRHSLGDAEEARYAARILRRARCHEPDYVGLAGNARDSLA